MKQQITIRNATSNDSETLLSLAKLCPPLDIHTQYTYWTMCNYFNDTIFILEVDGVPSGYIMSLNTREAIFVWQIGILPQYQGLGLSRHLIDEIAHLAAINKKLIQLSISADNIVSYSTFNNYCERNDLQMTCIGRTQMGNSCDEVLYQIDL